MIDLDNWRYLLHFRLKFYLPGECLSLLGFPHSLGFYWLSSPSKINAVASLRSLMVLGEVCPVLLLFCVTHGIYLCKDCPPVYSVRGLSYSRTQSISVYGICKCSISTGNTAYFIHPINVNSLYCVPGTVIDTLDFIVTMTKYLLPSADI